MSGFIAIINTNGAPVESELLEKLTASLQFRGPDRQQTWTDASIGLGHALFCTTDESRYERQPCSLDGKVWITGSIRIDAREELLKKLDTTLEINLNNTPDSELVLHAYRKWGENCLNHLSGDFAFVLWDKSEKKLLCARDHFGMRQLYHAQTGNSVIISNSLHCILQHPAISTQLDDLAIGGFLLFGDHSWLDKSLTAYTDVKTLLPAHTLTLHRNKTSIRQYWDIPANTPLLRYRDKNDYVDHFQEVFKYAVSDRLRTDRIVISMSGGMDSSAIAATAREIQEENRAFELNAITVVYDNVHPCQERYYAGLVARHLDLQIHYIEGDPYPLLSQPLATTRPLENLQPSLWLDMMQKTRLLGRVVLTGAAADNLMAYPASLAALKTRTPHKTLLDIIRLHHQSGKWPGLGTGLRARLKGMLSVQGNQPVTAFPYPPWLNHEFESRMHLKERWNETWASENRSSAFSPRHSQLHDSLMVPDWCADDILMTNNFTLPEQRDPYLDLRMVKLILSLPALPWLFNKDILRRSMETRLPDEVINRPKTPLGSLQSSLLKSPDTRWVDKWRPLPETQSYIERSMIPGLTGEGTEQTSSYVNIRPLLLNIWLETATRIR